jgi:DinB superfamily
MSQEDVLALVERCAVTPDRIARAAEDRDAGTLAARPAADAWSPRDILAHLRAADDILALRLVAMLVRDRPPLTAFDERRWADVAGYADADFHDLLRTFAARRAELIAMLRRLGPEDWQRQGLHEQHGPITLHRTLGQLVEHEAEHCAQIEALLA